jgi:hypothetical protein
MDYPGRSWLFSSGGREIRLEIPGYSFSEFPTLQPKIPHDRPRPIFEMGSRKIKNVFRKI